MRKKNLIGLLILFLLIFAMPIASSGEAEHVWSSKEGIPEPPKPFDFEIKQLDFVEISNDKLAIVAEDQNITISFYTTNPAEKTMPTKSSLKKINKNARLSIDHTPLGRGGHKWGYRLKLPNQKFKATALIESTTPIEITDTIKGTIATDFTIISFEDVLEYGYAVETTQLNATTAIISITKDYQKKGIKTNDWIYIDPTAVVSTEITFESYNPTIAIDETNIHIAWHGAGSVAGSDIFYKTKTKNGNWGTNTEIVSTKSTGSSYNPVIAVDETNIHIIWESGYGTDKNIFYKTKTKNGNWGTNTEIVSTETANHYLEDPAIAVDETNIHIVWRAYNYITNKMDIFYRTKTKNGNWETTKRISTETTKYSFEPAIAVDETNIHIIWGSGYGTDQGIFYKTKTKNGNWGTNTETVSTENTDWCSDSAIAVDETNIHITWLSNIVIFYKTKTKNGNWTDTNKEMVSTENTYLSWTPAIAVDETNIHIVWQEDGSGTGYSNIFYKTKTKGGSWGTNAEVVSAESTRYSVTPKIVVDETNVYTTWADVPPGPIRRDYDILFKSWPNTGTCNNNIQDASETDIDCGGNCVKCNDGKTCLLNQDCATNYCNAQGICGIQSNETCNNNTKDASETDVDCGGPQCVKCDDGKSCSVNQDCTSNYCNPQGTCDIKRDLYIEWIKPIQVVEDVPLVAGKATVVRVKVVNNGPETDTDVSVNYGNGCFTETKPVTIQAYTSKIVDFYPPNTCTHT